MFYALLDFLSLRVRTGLHPALKASIALRMLAYAQAMPASPAWRGSAILRALDLSAGASRGRVSWIPAMVLGTVLLLVPFAPTAVSVMLVWSCGALCLALRLWGNRFFFPRGFVAPGVAFIVVLCLSTVTSLSPGSSLEALVLWATYVLLAALLAMSLDDMGKVGFVLLCLLVSASLSGAYGLYQFSRGIETQSAWLDKEAAKVIQTRVYSVFDNPNMFAAYLAFLLPLAAYLFLNTPRWSSRILMLPVGVLMVGGLAFTYTRGAWVGSAVGLAALGFLRDRKVLLAMLAVMVAAPFLFPSTVLDRFSTIGSLEDSSNLYRLTIWRATWLMVKDYWASGVGLGPVPYTLVYPLYEIAGTPTVHAHNLYLQVLVEMGLPGLLVFLWLMRNAFRAGLSLRGSPYHSGIVLALVAGLVGQVIYGLADNIWYSPKNLFLFWAVVGMIAASSAALGSVESP
jgi:O-antigen ligase